MYRLRNKIESSTNSFAINCFIGGRTRPIISLQDANSCILTIIRCVAIANNDGFNCQSDLVNGIALVTPPFNIICDIAPKSNIKEVHQAEMQKALMTTEHIVGGVNRAITAEGEYHKKGGQLQNNHIHHLRLGCICK